ncbi:MAG: DUF1826 domain-containing protein [Pseudomonadota bacterium]
MRRVFSDKLGDFAAVYEDVELVSVDRPTSVTTTSAGAWMAQGGKIEAQWKQSASEPEAAGIALAPIRDQALRSSLCDEISQGVDLLTDLLDCATVGLRAATLSGPMCPRFHTDRVRCRMLITLGGPATEWIAHEEVDFDLLADRDSREVPLRTGGHVRTFNSGAWSLLKGGRWDHHFQGVVHRSPHAYDARLLLTFDPLFRN